MSEPTDQAKQELSVMLRSWAERHDLTEEQAIGYTFAVASTWHCKLMLQLGTMKLDEFKPPAG